MIITGRMPKQFGVFQIAPLWFNKLHKACIFQTTGKACYRPYLNDYLATSICTI